MQRFWKRAEDRDLEAQLRSARPEPKPELTRAIADQVRPRRGGLLAGVGRIPFTLAGGLTAVVLVAVIALGGIGASLNAASKALDLQNLAISPSINYGSNTPTELQYGSRVTVCVGGFVQLRLYTNEANALVQQGLVVIGSCTGATPADTLPRLNVCIGGYIGLRLSTPQAQSLISQGKAVSGTCP